MSEDATKVVHEPSWFYKVFGGTLLSLVGLLTLTVFSICYNSVNEARQETGRLSTELAKCVRQADLDARVQNLWLQVRDAIAARDAMKEKLATLETQVKQEQDEAKSLTKEIQALRERLAVIEGKLQPKVELVPVSKE